MSLGVLDSRDTTRGRPSLLFVGLAKVLGGGGTIGRMSRIVLVHRYEHIISLENLLLAWKEFRLGKKNRKDVLVFERNLMTNIISLHQTLLKKEYRHSLYEAFTVADPKPRNIHKASIQDRLVHHAIYRILYQFFDRTFSSDSYSCRYNKGTHKAIQRFRAFSYKVSKNNTKAVWVLKCDIRKFFASIDQGILIKILKTYIPDANILSLLSEIIESFHSTKEGVGLPLGNLTSQLLVNIYMNEFDQFVKHRIKAKYYIRYADDFVFLSDDKNWLQFILPTIEAFLMDRLKLSLHPDKVYIKTLASGVDFLGWVHFPDHRVLRTATKRRMQRRMLEKESKTETIGSYLGLLSHGNAQKLISEIKNK